MTYLEDSLDAIRELTQVNARELAVVSVAKCKTADDFYLLRDVAFSLGLTVGDYLLTCEDGEEHDHLLVSDNSFTIAAARTMIKSAENGTLTRGTLQLNLGELFGYDHDSIIEFIGSDVSRTCPCSCCGGKNNTQSPQVDREAQIRRTMYHAK